MKEFGLETLKDLDGGIVVEGWNQAVARAAADCEDRPGVTKARKVTLELVLVPVCSEQGHLESVKGSFNVKDTAPIRSTRSYDLRARKKMGQVMLAFSEEFADNADQHALPFEEE